MQKALCILSFCIWWPFVINSHHILFGGRLRKVWLIQKALLSVFCCLSTVFFLCLTTTWWAFCMLPNWLIAEAPETACTIKSREITLISDMLDDLYRCHIVCRFLQTIWPLYKSSMSYISPSSTAHHLKNAS